MGNGASLCFLIQKPFWWQCVLGFDGMFSVWVSVWLANWKHFHNPKLSQWKYQSSGNNLSMYVCVCVCVCVMGVWGWSCQALHILSLFQQSSEAHTWFIEAVPFLIEPLMQYCLISRGFSLFLVRSHMHSFAIQSVLRYFSQTLSPSFPPKRNVRQYSEALV